MSEISNQQPSGGTVHVTQIVQEKKSNGLAVAGFVLALLGLLFSWVPVVGWILWTLGLIFSLIGVFRKPRGLAIAGLIITFINLIILIFVISAIVGAIGIGALMS